MNGAFSASITLDRTCRTRIGKLARTRTVVGITRCKSRSTAFSRNTVPDPTELIPPTGNQWVRTAKPRRASTRTISGTDVSSEVPARHARSPHLPARLASQTPRGTEISHASAVATVARINVLRARIPRRFRTGELYANE